MADKLLPCPFCGCAKIPVQRGNDIGDVWLECTECGASTRLRENIETCTKDWNRRAASAATLTEDELRAEFEYQHEGRNLKQHKLRGTYVSAPIAALWNQHKRTAIWMQSRSMAASPAGKAATVQWWLAELDQYGNAKLVDGQHSDRAGADKAMYLFNALRLARGKRYAVARVELSEPKPSADGVNHEAVAQCNEARAAMSAHKEDCHG